MMDLSTNADYDFSDRRARFMQGLTMDHALHKQKLPANYKYSRNKRREHISAKRFKVHSDDITSANEGNAFDWAERFEQVTSELANFPALKQSELLDRLRYIRKRLSHPSAPVLKLIESGFLTTLDKLLQYQNAEVMLEALWCITNLSASSREVMKVIDFFLPKLLNIIQTVPEKLYTSLLNSYLIKEQAVWTVANFALESKDTALFVVDSGIIGHLCDFLYTKHTSLINITLWCLCNLARWAPESSVNGLMSPALLRLVVSFCHDQDRSLDALWLLSYLTKWPQFPVEKVVDGTDLLNMIQTIITLQVSKKSLPAMRVLGNLFYLSDTVMSYLIQPSNTTVVTHLGKFLLCDDFRLQREAIWIFSNIAAGPVSCLDILMEDGEQFLQCLRNLIEGAEVEISVKKETIFLLYNLAENAQCKYLPVIVQGGFLRFFVSMANEESQDQRVTELSTEICQAAQQAGLVQV